MDAIPGEFIISAAATHPDPALESYRGGWGGVGGIVEVNEVNFPLFSFPMFYFLMSWVTQCANALCIKVVSKQHLCPM